MKLGVSARASATSGSQVGPVQPAQLESAGLDCAPVAMVGLVGCGRLLESLSDDSAGRLDGTWTDVDGLSASTTSRIGLAERTHGRQARATSPYDHTRTGSFL